MAASRVFNIPELLTQIFTYLRDHSLYHLSVCACINKVWFDVATDILWGTPGSGFRCADYVFGPRELAGAARTRQQTYASKIVELDFTKTFVPGSMHSKLNKLKFPKLKKLSLQNGIGPLYGDGCELPSYFQFALLSLRLSNWDSLSGNFVDHLILRSPNLREVWFEDMDASIPAADFAYLFTRISVRRITLNNVDPELLTPELLRNLSCIQKLEYLNTGNSKWKELAFEATSDETQVLFPNLREVRLQLHSGSVPIAAHLFQSLTSLDLFINRLDAGVLPAIAKMLSLRRLKIFAALPLSLPGADFLALSSLSQLRVLSFSSRVSGNGRRFARLDVTDTDFNLFTTGLPLLEELDLCLDLKLSTTMFSSLSRNCPHLRTLAFEAPYDLELLVSQPAPLFPYMRDQHLI